MLKADLNLSTRPDHVPLECVPDKHAAVFVRVGPAGRMGFLVDPAVSVLH